MPYRLHGTSVINSATGEVVGRHSNRQDARRHLRALYANVSEAHKAHSGAMVGLFLSEPAATQLASAVTAAGLPAEPANELHITLCYLGDSAELAPYKEAIQTMLSAVTSMGLPSIQGSIGGVGRFMKIEDDGTNAFYASFDSVNLPAFRERVFAALQEVCPSEQQHGFTPHITLSYIPVAAPTPTLELPMIELSLGVLTLAWGGEHIEYPLGLGTTTKANYGARAGQTIAGNLARGQDGKFTSAGTSSGTTPSATPQVKPKPKPKPPTRPARRTGAGRTRRRAAVQQRRAGGRRPAQPRRSSGGRAAAPKKTPEQRTQEREQAHAQKRQENRDRVIQAMADSDQGLAPQGAKNLLAFADGDSSTDVASLEKLGLVEPNLDGSYRLTVAGRATAAAMNRGDARGAIDAIGRGQSQYATRQQRASERTQREAQREERRRQVEQRRVEREARQREREERRRTRAQPEAPEDIKRPPIKGKAGFAVFKDTRGVWRWILQSSNAYRDRDREIVSIKALEDDVQRSDTTGLYGTLRWWHVPGLDLGDCDYRVVHSKTLIESGTFRDSRIGAAIAQKADRLQASIGFVHPHTEPDAHGVYHEIHTFERSLVPRGKAANPFTRLVVKESPMLTAEKRQQLKEALGDDALLESLLSQISQTEKEADDAGIAFKEADATPGAPPAEPEAKAEEVEMVEETEAMDEASGEYVGDMSPDEFRGLLVAAFQEALAPVLETLNVEAKMRGALDEMKAVVSGYQTQKSAEEDQRDATIVQLQEQLASTQTQLKELLDDQPNSFFRPSRAPSRVVDPPAAALKEANKAASGGMDFFSDALQGYADGNRR